MHKMSSSLAMAKLQNVLGFPLGTCNSAVYDQEAYSRKL